MSEVVVGTVGPWTLVTGGDLRVWLGADGDSAEAIRLAEEARSEARRASPFAAPVEQITAALAYERRREVLERQWAAARPTRQVAAVGDEANPWSTTAARGWTREAIPLGEWLEARLPSWDAFLATWGPTGPQYDPYRTVEAWVAVTVESDGWTVWAGGQSVPEARRAAAERSGDPTARQAPIGWAESGWCVVPATERAAYAARIGQQDVSYVVCDDLGTVEVAEAAQAS